MSDSSVTTTPSTPRNRRIAAGAGLLALLLGTSVGVKAMVGGSDDTASCPDPANVQVAVAPEIYPVVAQQVSVLEKNPALCADYTVTRSAGESVGKAIKLGSSDVPDVWIPDSSIWVDDVDSKLGKDWATNSGSIASSPIVVGVPKAQEGVTGFDKTATWADFLTADKLPVSVQALDSSSSALVAMGIANRSATDHGDRTDLLRSIVRLSRSTLQPDVLASFAVQDAEVARAYPLSEAQLLAFNKSNPTRQLHALVPQEGAPQLDYPFVRPVKGRSAPDAVIQALLTALRGADTKSALSTAGFRVPGGSAPAGSPLPTDLKTVEPLSATEKVSAVKSWADLAKDARMLVLIDVSGSMSAEVKPGQSRIQLLSGTAKLALDALPPTTQIGAWGFSTDLDGKGKDYLEMAPDIAPIGFTAKGKAHKKDLITKLDQLPGLVAKNGDTGLYDSIWAAYQSATKSYQPDYINSIVIMTDGKNDDPGGGLSLQQLLANLKGAYKADKPIKIVAISMGEDTDPAAMKRIATTTDGLSYVTKTPDEIATVFIDAFLHRS